MHRRFALRFKIHGLRGFVESTMWLKTVLALSGVILMLYVVSVRVNGEINQADQVEANSDKNYREKRDIVLADAAKLECYTGNLSDLSDYAGTQSTTVSGRTCQRWDSNSPHWKWNWYKPWMFPENSFAHNYCRYTTDEGAPWCYTTDPAKRWEYCDITMCDRKWRDWYLTTTTTTTGENGLVGEVDVNFGFSHGFNQNETFGGLFTEYFSPQNTDILDVMVQRYKPTGDVEFININLLEGDAPMTWDVVGLSFLDGFGGEMVVPFDDTVTLCSHACQNTAIFYPKKEQQSVCQGSYEHVPGWG